MDHIPFIISWNTTRRCNLKCAHCYLDAVELEQGSEDELTTEQGFELIDDIASLNPSAFLVLTGGEPLLRDDIFELTAYASSRGLMPLLGTNGTIMDDHAAAKFKKNGLKGMGVSIHSMHDSVHDTFTGLEGSLKGAMEGIAACKRTGLDFQVQTVATRENMSEIPAIIEYSRRTGAKAFNLFFLVCTGRGQDLTDLTAEEYEESLSLLRDLQIANRDMMIRARCAPHFKRIARQQSPDDFLAGAEMSGCLAATNYCRITPDGDVTPCPYMPTVAGNIKQTGFRSVWEKSEQLGQLRNLTLKGKCGRCEFDQVCGGCRARAYAFKGDVKEEDPWCLYQPTGEKSAEEVTGQLQWTPEAEAILQKIPFFIRNSVKKGVVEYSKKKNISTITPQILTQMKKMVKPH